MLRATLCLALAIAAFVFPTSAVFAFTLVFAAFAAVDGVFSLITGIKGARSKEDRWGMYILRGLLGLGAGDVHRHAELRHQVLEAVDIRQPRQVAQGQRLVGQQRTRNERERGVLRAGDRNGAGEPLPADDA